MAQGYYRRKSRPQAQQEQTISQQRWDGALDVDTPAYKISSNEVAELVNLVAYRDYLRGHTGKKLYSSTPFPGSGDVWDWLQHPVTKRVLMHRGGQLWLSTDASMTAWDEVTPIGPDGSLGATGTFVVQSFSISGAAASYIFNVNMSGVTTGDVFSVVIPEGVTNEFTATIYYGDQPVCEFTGNVDDQPYSNAVFVEFGESGITATAHIENVPLERFDAIGGAIEVSTAEYTVSFSLRGLTLENTDEWELWWRVSGANIGDIYFEFFKDSAMTQLVASATGVWFEEFMLVTAENESGISGSLTRDALLIPDGISYDGTVLTFSPSFAEINGKSKIEPFLDNAFLVYMRDAGMTVFVDQRIKEYLFLGEDDGVPDESPFISNTGVTLSYRYLFSYSRIVDPVTGEPDYLKNRNSGSLQFEGPTRQTPNVLGVDYNQPNTASPISIGSSLEIEFLAFNGGAAFAANAAAYITHISIYRTLEINSNPSGREIYIWVADVPIYSTSYNDNVDDATLLNRGVAGYGLKTRFWSGMAKGIGALGPDFLFTAAPDTVRVDYTDVSVNPQFIGYHNPALQFMNVRSPVSQILRLRDLFAILSKTYTMYSVSGINENGGNPLAGEFVPVIKHLEPSSESIGINSPMSFAFLNETDFAAHCGDGTVRVFAGDRWGRALDGDNVHTLVGAARSDATLGFIRDALYLFYVDGAAARRCLRFGFGSYAGFNWSKIARDSWVVPPLGLRPMRLIDESGVDRLLAPDSDDENIYSFEDENDERQWVDDVGDSTIIIGGAADRFSNFEISGYLGDYIYGYYQAGLAYAWILFSDEAMTDEIGRFTLDAGAGEYSLTAVHAGVTATVDFNGDTDWPDGALDVQINKATVIDGAVAARFTDLLITGYSSTLYGYYQTGLAYTWVLFSDETMTDEVGRFDLTPAPGTVTLVPAAGYSGVAATVHFDGDISGPDGDLDILFPGYTDYEYPTRLRPRELTGRTENLICWHNESHTYLTEIPGQSMPGDFSMTARALADGAYVDGAVVESAPYDGDIQFRAQVSGRRIQLEYETSSARFQYASVDTTYESRDMASARGPSNTPEYAYQRELSTGLQQWLTRPYVAVNAANGADYTQHGGAPERVVDPTAAMYGLRFTGEISYTQGSQPDLSGDFTIMGWWEPEEASPTLLYVAGASVEASGNALVTPAGTIYNDVFTGGWKHIAIVRRSGLVSAYKDGAPLGAPVADAAVYSDGSVSIGNYAFKIFDLRVYGKEISAGALAYYVGDIQLNRGRKVLSVF